MTTAMDITEDANGLIIHNYIKPVPTCDFAALAIVRLRCFPIARASKFQHKGHLT
jgi:hypothetical protein